MTRIWHKNKEYANHPSKTCCRHASHASGDGLSRLWQGRTWPQPVAWIFPMISVKRRIVKSTRDPVSLPGCVSPPSRTSCALHPLQLCWGKSRRYFCRPSELCKQWQVYISTSGQLVALAQGRTIPTVSPLMSPSPQHYLERWVITILWQGMVSKNYPAQPHTPGSSLQLYPPPQPSVPPKSTEAFHERPASIQYHFLHL